MPIHLINGDAIKVLSRLPSSLVNCVITSPPYWGLRDYGTATWEGGSANCTHRAPDEAGQTTKPSKGQREHAGRFAGETCWSCGARRKDEQLGLEPTYFLYVEHMVEVFREVRRVLRKDGTLWLNLGDSYSSHDPGGYREGEFLNPDGRPPVKGQARNRAGNHTDLPRKNLIGIPWRVAFALQADGWRLRQDIIWSKPNPMPESIRDRCTKAHEYLFLLTKSARYYYDVDAIKEVSIDAAGKSRGGSLSRFGRDEKLVAGNAHRGDAKYASNGTRNKRSVWTIATAPFPEAHFATFPPSLVEPCVLAGCPQGGTVLDPFAGAGTVGLVASRLDRNAILVELSKPYCEMATRRLTLCSLSHYTLSP